MNTKRNIIIVASLVGIVMANLAYATTPTITDVTAQQRYPWNGKVDISYTVTGDIAEEAKEKALLPSLKVTATDRVADTTYTATQLSGDMGLEAGTHALVWDMDAEGLAFKATDVVFRVSCETTPATYCVIDLSAGANATSYPVTYMAEPPSGGFNVDEYKTTKLVLRRIEAGTFIMGEDQSDESHRVTLTKPFFCGIFEVTQKQYSLVMGSNPSFFSGDTLPVEQVSYNTIRGSSDGAKWPSSSDVDSTSFMGKLRARTGVTLDLPTEAQWEYACRAGTTTTYYWGDSMNGNYAWYSGNSSSKTHPVGTTTSNAWGLYDMSGNVWEWCLDWDGTLAYGIDPNGSSSGVRRVERGGGRGDNADLCASSCRIRDRPKIIGDYCGFRLVIPAVDEGDIVSMLCYGQSAIMAVNLTSGTRTAASTERIYYSAGWANGAGAEATAVVEVNGETMATGAGGGYVDWTPPWNGTYTFTHKVMSGNEQIGETLTATFLVEGRKPTFSPQSGTTFEATLSVSIAYPAEGATIHYTTDGSEPTVESPVYRRFRISGRTTVKTIAERDGLVSEVATAEYALGQCVDPVIAPEGGSSFEWAGQVVSISWQGEDGVLRYTTDGSDPTCESPVYEGPFTIDDSTVVKAKAFGDQFFDSAVVTAVVTRVWTDVAVPQIEAAASFTGSKAKVSISCATEGATIRYTTDGSEPDSDSAVYAGPIYVTDSCTVKAYAVKYDYRDSAVAAQGIVKAWSIGDTLGKPDHGFATDGSGGGTGWTRVADATAPNGEAMRSGAITDSQSSVLSTTVTGPGALSFAWRTSCEDSGGMYDWDHVELAVDGSVVLQLDGETAWRNESVEIAGDGAHTVEWRYVKDEVESAGDDAAWVANYSWASAWTATRTTEVPVPYAWLDAHDPDVVDEYEAYEASAKATAANGRKVWECYVLGLDPAVATDDFRITSLPMKADGTPDLANIVFDPPQEKWNVQGARAVVKGKARIDDGQWLEVPVEDGGRGATALPMRFFKVEVELP